MKIAYAISITLVALAAYWLSFVALHNVWHGSENILGAMWAAISALFVYRESRGESVMVSWSRFFATGVSFVLCLLYLLVFPPTIVGMAILIGAGTLLLSYWKRNDAITTTAITSTVVIVVSILDPHDAWHQPILRFVDTCIGIAVGLGGKFLLSHLYERFSR
jgi:uncharacterized membrane protein YccC